MKRSELEQYLEEYIGSAKNTVGYGDDFRVQRAQGLILLFELKPYFKNLSSMLAHFREARDCIDDRISCSDGQIDLMDEMEEVLIAGCNMPDFWTSNLEDFKSHFNFKTDFDCLDRGLG